MSKYSKVGVLIAVMAFCGLLASSSVAAEWHTNGPLSRTSTNAGASRLVVHPSGTIIACSSSSGHVTVNGPTSTAFPWTNAATVQPVFTGCSVSGAAGYVIVCSTGELRANSYAGGNTLATAGGGVTTGLVTNIDCRLSIGPTQCSTITGTVPAHYINPNPIASGAGRLTITTAGQNLTVHQVNACAGVPTGHGTFGSPGAGSTIQDLTYTVDGPNAPWVFTTL
jgi:hypothetical protein